MLDDPDYILDLSFVNPQENNPQEIRELQISARKAHNRKYISVLFECCGVYQHVYRNRAGNAYEGRCPHCLSPVRILIGPGGTHSRFFRAT